jgi:GTPase Era involved in 16S rRNA processing
MIAVLGTFSAGKSTFINEYIGKAPCSAAAARQWMTGSP